MACSKIGGGGISINESPRDIDDKMEMSVINKGVKRPRSMSLKEQVTQGIKSGAKIETANVVNILNASLQAKMYSLKFHQKKWDC